MSCEPAFKYRQHIVKMIDDVIGFKYRDVVGITESDGDDWYLRGLDRVSATSSNPGVWIRTN